MIAQLAQRALKFAPAPIGIRLVDLLMATTQEPAATPDEQAAMAAARRRSYGRGNAQRAWQWGDHGPMVVLVHGWSGSPVQMAPLASQLAGDGFRCVVPEVTGHGESVRRRTSWEHFMDDVAALARSLDEEVHAYVGHSAGALSMMAARDLRGIRAQKYVCICAPSYPWLHGVEKRLTQRRSLVEGYQDYTARQFRTTWRTLLTGASYANLGADLLLFYDRKDKFLPDTEGDKIAALCPGATLLKTEKYGHSKVLAAPELIAAVRGFLARSPAATPAGAEAKASA